MTRYIIQYCWFML